MYANIMGKCVFCSCGVKGESMCYNCLNVFIQFELFQFVVKPIVYKRYTIRCIKLKIDFFKSDFK